MKLGPERCIARTVTAVLAGIAVNGPSFAQVEACVAELDRCIELAEIPEEARESVRLREEVWFLLMRGQESGEAYLMEEVGLQRDGARAMAEYALWAIDAMDAYADALQAHYCGLLDSVTTGSELNELYQAGWDWEQRRNEEHYRLATGVFAILSEPDTAILLAYLDDVMKEPLGISVAAPLIDIETWSPERVARIKALACEED